MNRVLCLAALGGAFAFSACTDSAAKTEPTTVPATTVVVERTGPCSELIPGVVGDHPLYSGPCTLRAQEGGWAVYDSYGQPVFASTP
jgi:hypothetical protein